MALVNYATQEINAKIVYYGPERMGKGLSLRYVYDRLKPQLRGELKTVPAGGSSLLFFDFSPFEQPVFGGYRIRFHLYTLLGKVDNPAAWKMILKGADGLVIVADAASAGMPAGRRSLTLLRGILGSYGIGLDDIPWVLQVPRGEGVSEESLREELGIGKGRICPVSVQSGEGVLEALTSLSHTILERIAERDDLPGLQPATLVQASMGETPPERIVAGGEGGDGLKAAGRCADGHALAISGGVAPGTLALADDGVRVEGGTVVVPLEISLADGGRQRLTLTLNLCSG